MWGGRKVWKSGECVGDLGKVWGARVDGEPHLHSPLSNAECQSWPAGLPLQEPH